MLMYSAKDKWWGVFIHILSSAKITCSIQLLVNMMCYQFDKSRCKKEPKVEHCYEVILLFTPLIEIVVNRLKIIFFNKPTIIIFFLFPIETLPTI